MALPDARAFLQVTHTTHNTIVDARTVNVDNRAVAVGMDPNAHAMVTTAVTEQARQTVALMATQCEQQVQAHAMAVMVEADRRMIAQRIEFETQLNAREKDEQVSKAQLAEQCRQWAKGCIEETQKQCRDEMLKTMNEQKQEAEANARKLIARVQEEQQHMNEETMRNLQPSGLNVATLKSTAKCTRTTE